MTSDEYCRELESYLCRKNDGHLIRIVGPSFERVCGWAEQGIPLKVACQGIDAYFVRYYAKGRRRRPVQIDFCENDVIDAFEAWRRAVGVRMPGGDATEGESESKRRKRSLRDHLDRVCERITDRRAGLQPLPADFDALLEKLTVEVAALRDAGGSIRGDARERVSLRLGELDRLMLDAAYAQSDPVILERLRAEAEDQLLPFRDRMPGDAYNSAVASAVDRLLREHEKLPIVTFD